MTAKWLLLRLAGSTAGRPTTVVLYISGDLDEKFRPMLADCLTQLASKHPRPPVHRTLLHCRQPGRWDIELSDDTAPAHAWPGRVMATS